VDFVGQFFSGLGDGVVALWEFAGGVRGLAVTIGSAVLTAVFCLGALKLRDSSGWLSSILGMMAATIAMFWAFGIIPSAWVLYSDSSKDILGGRVIPNALPAMGNFYELFRDTVVVAETGIAVGAFAVIALWVQKRWPRALAEGEQTRPQSGGYK